MNNLPEDTDNRNETHCCHVFKNEVEISAKYRFDSTGKKTLVDFGCNKYGLCGITSWDPCPLYVVYRENKTTV